jgi:SAM-dependent methyltransferase
VDEWGVGSYEHTAAELAPVSDVAVAALRLSPAERMLDIACGTGNAALVAHRGGAVVTGLDASPRLLEVARTRVPGAEFVHGNAAQLPFDDDQFDVVASVFGVIFARPAERVVAEIARVLRPGGRAVITTWPPRGPIFAAVSLMRQALARSRPPDTSAAPVNWGDPAVVEQLLGPYGDVAVTELELANEAIAPEEFWERWERLHPMWIAARRQLEPAGGWEPLREASIAALHDSGVGDGVPSPYLLAVLTRR